MFKVGSHDPFRHLKHKLWPKEGSWLKLAIWFPTTKSQESPQFHCVQVACDILLKSSWRGLQLCLRFHINRRFAHKVMGVPTLGISRLPLGSPGTKWHLSVGLVAKHRVHYKWEGGGFPQVWAVVSCVSMCLPMVHLCTKMLQLRSNQLVV
jgi:hypothetical protein